MLSKQFIQDYFNADFKGIQSLLSEILIPIFQDYEEGYTEITVQTDKAKDMAKAAHIKTIKHVATLGGLAFDVKVFDVTLEDDSRIHKSRKKIQELVRQFVDRFEGAFIVFHYEDPKDRSWRLSYLEKRESNTASTNAKRYTYLCGQQYPCRTLADRFYKLQSLELTAVNLEKAFSVETLSDEFFDEYRYFYQDLVDFVCNEKNLIDGFVDYANGNNELAEKFVRDYIKKLMGRLVFIQFLQNKAWLNNDIHYTHTLFDNCSEKQKENFLDNVLEPLFFGVFNTPKEEREVYFRSQSWDMHLYEQWKDFPYLNGGLFECDELDKISLPLPDYFFSNPEKKDNVRTPNDEFYSDACGIFDFFDRYNFTIDESDPLDREVGVDPEMLGKIFENLLEDNNDKGAFYTPKEIVEYMCREALVAYLVDEARCKSEVNKQRQINFEEAIRTFVTDPEMSVSRMQRYDRQQLIDLNESLCNVKICDPAIGSGAFPMGLLNLLMNCRIALNNALHKNEPPAWLKKEIIQNNIYGVDIEKGAIDIARLRFWLSIVVDLDEPEALPNFDYKFMQGNSLLEQYKGVDLMQIAEVQKRVDSGGYQISLFENELDICRKELYDKVDEYYNVSNHLVKKNLREEINGLVQQQLNLQHVTAELSDIDIAANDQFFLWHTWFADVFNRPSKQGFDIVIGNPPYFKYEGTHKGEIDTLRKTDYLKIAFGGKLNAYKLFLALAIKYIAKKNGIITYIFQNSFLGDLQAANLRIATIEENQPLIIDSFPERDSKKKRVFESVKMSVCILIMKTANTSHSFKVNFWDDKYKSSGTQTYFDRNEIKAIDPDGYTIPRIESYQKALVIKLKNLKTLPLKCYEGELNMTFHKKYFTKNTTFPKVLKGASVQRYYITEQMSQGEIEYLDEALYFAENSGEKTIHHNQERVVMQGMTGANDKIRIIMSLVPAGYYLANSCNYLLPNEEFPAKYLLGLLNSRLINWFFRRFSTNSNVNGYEVEQFPVANASESDKCNISDLVGSILAKKQANPSADTSAEERAIDNLVYDLYGLTEDERKIIEDQSR